MGCATKIGELNSRLVGVSYPSTSDYAKRVPRSGSYRGIGTRSLIKNLGEIDKRGSGHRAAILLDDLGGTDENVFWNWEVQGFCGSHIDH